MLHLFTSLSDPQFPHFRKFLPVRIKIAPHPSFYHLRTHLMPRPRLNIILSPTPILRRQTSPIATPPSRSQQLSIHHTMDITLTNHLKRPISLPRPNNKRCPRPRDKNN